MRQKPVTGLFWDHFDYLKAKYRREGILEKKSSLLASEVNEGNNFKNYSKNTYIYFLKQI